MTNRHQWMHNGLVTGSAALQSSQFLNGMYQDLRDKSRYHNDLNCPIGRRIPEQFVHPGHTPNARLCKTCASGDNHDAPTLYRV